ncbi:MAG: hypothetical protein FWH20_04510 [Oscillospiraceae bacterium]|nr:hypothetical protein [Oscillospiraceae bacterium]
MDDSIVIRERQKYHLGVLLKLKKRNVGVVIIGLQDEIENAVMVMEQEDVAFVEKIVGISAL